MLSTLHEKYYMLFSELYASRSVLPDKQYKAMAEALMSEYKRELFLVESQISLDVSQKMFEVKFQLKHQRPRGGLFRNSAGKLLKKLLKVEQKIFLANIENARKAARKEKERVEKNVPPSPPVASPTPPPALPPVP